MLNVHKILFPIEFHETSLRIFRVAAGIARRFDSEIVLLHVVAPANYSPQDWKGTQPLNSDTLLGELLEYSDRELHSSLRTEIEGLRLKSSIRKGYTASEIVEAARDESIDLIVMPSRGYKGFYRHLMGSVTAKVMHDTDRPVLASAHLETRPDHNVNVKRVLCGVTFSEHSLQVLRCAAKVAAEFQAGLTIAHVTPDVERYGPGGMVVDRGWKDELVLSAQELIAKIQRQADVKGDAAVGSGDPGVVLSQIAQRTGADLIVVGCHDSGGHFGSNVSAIISESQIPVLSV